MSFTAHSQLTQLSGIICPRYVFDQVPHVETDRAKIDARTKAINDAERQRNLDAESEVRTEGRAIFHRPNRNGE